MISLQICNVKIAANSHYVCQGTYSTCIHGASMSIHMPHSKLLLSKLWSVVLGKDAQRQKDNLQLNQLKNNLLFNEPNPWGLSMPAMQYNFLPHLPKVNKEQARMQSSSQLTVRVGWVGVGVVLLLLNSPTKLIAVQQ